MLAKLFFPVLRTQYHSSCGYRLVLSSFLKLWLQGSFTEQQTGGL